VFNLPSPFDAVFNAPTLNGGVFKPTYR